MGKITWVMATLLAISCSSAKSNPVHPDIPKEQWTFKFKEPEKQHMMGLIKPKKIQGAQVSQQFLVADVVIPKSFDLANVTKLSPILDQGNCGSCVYHSVTSNFADSWLLRAPSFGNENKMSVDYLMQHAEGMRCNGSYFSLTGPGTKGGLPLMSDCPYSYGRSNCSGVKVHGSVVQATIINNSPKSIMTALVNKIPVSVTVGANASFQGYSGGIYNACASTATNHETLLQGFDCETSVDANGNCQFDAQGKLPAGVGFWIMRNSWGERWGEKGLMRIKITSASGRLCNNIADEAGVLDTGVNPEPPVPPKPPVPPVPPSPPAPEPDGWGSIILKILHWILSLFNGALLFLHVKSARAR